MLFMVIERFKGGDPAAVGQHFAAKGRMLPKGVRYHASWMSADGAGCFQIMEAADRASLEPWLAAWSDLVDFDVTVIRDSKEFWAARRQAG